MVQYKVLGPFSVTINNQDCTPSAAKVRQVLALTLLRANQIVSLDAIIEELWGDSPPRSAVATTQTYIYQIRKLLAQHSDERTANQTMRTAPPGYLLNVGPEQLDSWEFDRIVGRARVLLERRQPEPAAGLLGQALAMWNGPVLVDVAGGPLLQRYAARLEEKRMLALELRLRADMGLGRHRELIAELKSLVLTYPYHEWFHAQLMIALHRSGRRGEALTTFRQARQLLNDQLGIEPSADLQQIHRSILKADALAG
jgi:DNA-binding SARP family transcriptional activator